MSFKTKKYQVIKGALSQALSNFIFNYMLLQRDAVDLMLENIIILFILNSIAKDG